MEPENQQMEKERMLNLEAIIFRFHLKLQELPPPKTNMSTENPPLEDVISYWNWGYSNVMLVFRGVHETSCIIEEWLSLTLGSIGPRTRARFGERWRVFEKVLNSKRFNASKNIFDKGDFSEHFRTSEQQDFICLSIFIHLDIFIHCLFSFFFFGGGESRSFI